MNGEGVYSFLQKPTNLHTNFLGLIELADNSKSIILAIFAGITQFIQGYLSSPISPKVEVLKDVSTTDKKSFQDELSSSMQMNIKYILPVFIAFISWKISAAIALYFVVSNIFTIIQEWYIRRVLENKIN